jgi:hypothetical protein
VELLLQLVGRWAWAMGHGKILHAPLTRRKSSLESIPTKHGNVF